MHFLPASKQQDCSVKGQRRGGQGWAGQGWAGHTRREIQEAGSCSLKSWMSAFIFKKQGNKVQGPK
ncbi:UNVERIFIED_CONTAM: hypothetical protein FKN15_027594 [Acipenser sinensis]